MIGYFITFETDDLMGRIGPFFNPIPIDEKRVAKELRNTLPQHLAILGPDSIEEILLIATDGYEHEIIPLDPDDFFPVISTTKNDKKFYTQKGGEK